MQKMKHNVNNFRHFYLHLRVQNRNSNIHVLLVQNLQILSTLIAIYHLIFTKKTSFSLYDIRSQLFPSKKKSFTKGSCLSNTSCYL